jgi:hypothetical protein
MKQIIYITKNKVWFGGVASDWVGGSLTEVFKVNKQKLDASDVKMVLGIDVGFVASFPKSKVGELTRESVLAETRNHMPIEVEMECFDWNLVMVDKEPWVQSMAVEKEFLQFVSRAAIESGIKVNLMIPIGILVGQKSLSKESPMLIKWTGAETLSVLAVHGLVDSVFQGVEDQQLLTFAKNKWALAVDPEIITLDDISFVLSDEAFKEKYKGSDEEILNIPIFRNPDLVSAKSTSNESIPGGISFDSDKQESPIKKNLVVILLALAIVVVFGVGGWILFGPKKTETGLTLSPVVSVAPTAIPTPTATPSAAIDFGEYSVQVLNGSGIAGLAAGVRDSLLVSGFGTVDIGNAPETVKGSIQTKLDLSPEVITKARESVSEFVINNTGTLTNDNKYDLVIVLGSEKN